MLSDIFNDIVFLFFKKKKMLVETCYDSHPTGQGTETYRAVGVITALSSASSGSTTFILHSNPTRQLLSSVTPR